MNETVLNRIIKENLNKKNWGHKIADSSNSIQMTQNPFDGFGYTEQFGINWESKLIKNDYAAFNILNQLKPHQIMHLSKIREITKNWKTQVLNIVTFGIYFPRKYIEIFSFSIDFINKCIKEERTSILKKELIQMHEKEMGIIVKSHEFAINLLKEKMIEEI